MISIISLYAIKVRQRGQSRDMWVAQLKHGYLISGLSQLDYHTALLTMLRLYTFELGIIQKETVKLYFKRTLSKCMSAVLDAKFI